VSDAASIYPIRQLYFQCSGCKAQWMLRADPPIRNIDEFKAFTSSPEKMEPCPQNCGARTCSIAFRVPGPEASPGAGRTDPFSVFKERTPETTDPAPTDTKATKEG
jgi:hypothetical protein